MGAIKTATAEDCLRLCKQTADCEWFTFHRTDGVCSLTADCKWVDETCGEDCVYGPRSCTAEKEGRNINMYVIKETNVNFILMANEVTISRYALHPSVFEETQELKSH